MLRIRQNPMRIRKTLLHNPPASLRSAAPFTQGGLWAPNRRPYNISGRLYGKIHRPFRRGDHWSPAAVHRTYSHKIPANSNIPPHGRRIGAPTAPPLLRRTPKPPLCKGRCQPNRLTEGLSRQNVAYPPKPNANPPRRRTAPRLPLLRERKGHSLQQTGRNDLPLHFVHISCSYHYCTLFVLVCQHAISQNVHNKTGHNLCTYPNCIHVPFGV